MHQVTIWATLTDDTPRTITALLTDPRTDSDTGTTTPEPTSFYHSAPALSSGVFWHAMTGAEQREGRVSPKPGLHVGR